VDTSKKDAKAAPRWRIPWGELTGAAFENRAELSQISARWGSGPEVGELVDAMLSEPFMVGWSPGFEGKEQPWLSTHPLVVPLSDADGVVRSAVRRWIGGPRSNEKPKALQLSRDLTKHEGPMYLGSVPEAVAAVLGGAPLIIAEGEIDTLLLHSMARAGQIRGGVVGFPGGSMSTRWLDGLRAALRSAGIRVDPEVVIAVDADEAGDRYADVIRVTWPRAGRVDWPSGQDPTDVAAARGLARVAQLISEPKIEPQRIWILDSGEFAILDHDGWQTIRGKGPIQARLVRVGHTPGAARQILEMVPPARSMVCDPTTTGPIIWSHPPRLNTWRGLGTEIEPGRSFGVLSDLLRHLVGDDEAGVKWLLDWLALPLASLWSGKGAFRTGVAVVLYGTQGTGKGWLGELLRALYGRHWLTIGQSQIEDKFAPAELENCLMLVANEVASGHAGREAATLNRLKSWVTEENIQIRAMQQRARMTPIAFNLVFCSNSLSPVRIESHDRRYTFFEQRRPIPDELIDRLRAEKRAGWPSARGLLAALVLRDVPRQMMKPHANAARSTQLDLCVASDEAFAAELADLGIELVARHWLNDLAIRNQMAPAPHEWRKHADGVASLHMAALHAIYAAWSKAHGYRHPARASTIAEVIIRRVDGAKRGRPTVDGTRARGLVGLPFGPRDAAPAEPKDRSKASKAAGGWAN